MGFAVMPKDPRPGVYVLKETGDIVIVVSSWFFHPEIIFKARQKRPRMAYPILMQKLKYIGSFE